MQGGRLGFEEYLASLPEETVFAVVFEQAIRMISPLVDSQGGMLYKVDPNSVPEKIRPFFGRGFVVANLTPIFYLTRIRQYFGSCVSYYVLALVYLNRLISKIDPASISYVPLYNNITFYRLFFVATVLAIKFIEDNGFKMGYYALVAGIQKGELENLERCFLELIDSDLYVSPDEFECYFNQLMAWNQLSMLAACVQ